MLVVAVHLPSKLHLDLTEHTFYAGNLYDIISRQELHVGHSNTLVIGDFNMDPFETGMVIAGGLHSVMDRTLVRDEGRTLNGKNFKMFYNPMWNFLGDNSQGPPGTYFYNSGTPLNYFWHTFDQVLLRPSLLSGFSDKGLSVVTKAGDTELLRETGRINSQLSDHLPIVLRLEVEGRL